MLGWQEGDRGRAQETTQEEKLQVREERHRRDMWHCDNNSCQQNFAKSFKVFGEGLPLVESFQGILSE